MPLRIEEVLLAIGMAAIALITAANVLTRYLTDISLAFTEEYSVVLMVLVTLLGASLAMARGAHVRIPYFSDLLPPRARRAAEAAGLALSVLCFGLLAWLGARMAWDDYRFEVTSPGLGVEQWQYTVWLPVLAASVALRALGRIGRLLRP